MRFAGWSLAIGFSVLFGARGASAQSWEQIDDEDGVRVWQRDVPGTSLVEFRGQGMIEAPIQMVAAVIHNANREKEWMENCTDSFFIQLKSTHHVISYNRTASPVFFISDRDAVVEADQKVLPEKKTLRVEFHQTTHPKMPPVDGVVRIPKVDGFWEMVYVGPRRTELTYQIQADPGGSLPKWLVNWASKSLPLETIKRLRAQVAKGGYEKDLEVMEMSVDWDSLTGTSTKSAAASRAGP